MNQITINFTPCSPALSYRVFYREIGEVSFIEYPDEFVSSPIIFQVEGPTDQLYEGYIVSVCEGDVLGPQVPWETVLCPPPEGCCDPVVIDAEAETIIPDGSGSESGGGAFFRLVFNVDMSGETLGDWNLLFDHVFDQVIYSAGGTIVDLYTPGPVVTPGAIFDSNTTLVRVLDGFFGLITELGDTSFRICTSLIEVDLPACTVIGETTFFLATSITDIYLPLVTSLPVQCFAGTSVLTNLTCPNITSVGVDSFNGSGLTDINFAFVTTAGAGAFQGMDNLLTITLPLLVSIGSEGIRNEAVITDIYIPSCTALGETTGDDQVFLLTIGQTITLTIPTATATDLDVAYLEANNTVTLILV